MNTINEALNLIRQASEIVTDLKCPTNIVKINPLTAKLPLASEVNYLDYSDPLAPVTRQRCMKVGANMDLICPDGRSDNVIRPNPNVADINAAIIQASVFGGRVAPSSAASIVINGTPIEIQDNVILDLDDIGEFDMQGGIFEMAVESVEKENFAITCLRVNGNNLNRIYAVKIEGSQNFIVQMVETRNMDQDSISMDYQCINATVRYCDLKPGRDEDGGGTNKNQHGIVNSSIPASNTAPYSEPAPSARFGIVYSYGHTYYSNKIDSADGLAIDSHASNLEVMGNYCADAVFMVKYPHSSNVMIHHNNHTNNRTQDNTINFRLYSANDYAAGVGYEGDKVFVFENIFDSIEGYIRTDVGHGEKHFIKNTYTNCPNMEFRLTDVENGLALPAYGKVYRWGNDINLNVVYNSLSTPADMVEETNLLLRDCDHLEMIRLMNLPKETTWAANVDHPLPLVEAY